MSYIPGAGLKKPLNAPENPIYPDIRKGPPRFVNSGKYWTVDEGQTMKDTENHSQFYEPYILVQSRAHASQAYGVSSHKDVVNDAFRPPLRTFEDDMPLSRQPREPLFPRMNAGTDGTETGFLAQNTTPHNIPHHIEDKVGHGHLRPTFACPFDTPVDNSTLPELYDARPLTSATTNGQAPFKTPGDEMGGTMIADLYPVMPSVGVKAPSTAPVRLDAYNSIQDIELFDTKPQTSGRTNPGADVDFIDYRVPTPQTIERPSYGVKATSTPIYRTQNGNSSRTLKQRTTPGDAHNKLVFKGCGGIIPSY